MINELNVTPMQYLSTLFRLLLLMVILSHLKSHTVIDPPEVEPDQKPTANPYYGACIQSQSKYYN